VIIAAGNFIADGMKSKMISCLPLDRVDEARGSRASKVLLAGGNFLRKMAQAVVHGTGAGSMTVKVCVYWSVRSLICS
jgi:hypothetical protein